MTKFFQVLLFCSVHFFSWTQIVRMDSCWTSPIGTTPELSAGFGDIRPNHFHMGLDFRTNGVEGIPLYAVAEGYVSRIRISSTGYGRVIYINHPNGLTSVYAHCSRFSDRILAVILPLQCQFQQNEFDWSFSPGQLPVTKGEQIALSGNSGNSTGPHLHFELRDTKTEHALNPFLHGFHVSDNASPTLHGIRIVGIDQNGYLIPGKSLNVSLTKSHHVIQIPKNFISSNEKIGVCISVTDPLKAGGHGFGLYAAELWTDQSARFGFELKDISFDDSRYVNNHMDYNEYKSKGIKYQKLFRNKNNPLGIYTMQSLGGIALLGNDSISCSLMLSDVNGNEAQHTLHLVYPYVLTSVQTNHFNPKDYFLPDSSYVFQSKNILVEVEANTFYEPIKKTLNLNAGQFGTSSAVLQKSICLRMKVSPTLNLSKYYISVGETSLETSVEDDWLLAESKQLGAFTVKVDTISPTIEAFPTSSNVIIPSFLSWNIMDKQSGLARYDLFIDGKWTPVYFDQKNNRLSWKNDRNVTIIGPKSDQTISLRLVVRDRCGNERVWEKQFSLIDAPH